MGSLPARSVTDERILVVGTGALATLFAARLSAAGNSVAMLGTWREGVQTLNQRGAQIVGAEGERRAYPVRASDNPADFANVRYAIVLVKAWQTARAAAQLKGILAPNGIALTLQNGLGNYEALTHELGAKRVALGTIVLGATSLAPALVQVGGEGLISLAKNSALTPLEEALRAARFNVQTTDDAQALIWGKLVVNAAVNPLTALTGVRNGELLADAQTRKIMGALAQETAEAAQAQGIRLPFENPVAAAEEAARKTASNYSSMLQDLRRGAPTEIEAICGEIARRGEARGLNMPYNRACLRLVQTLIPK
ncbi:MAG: 2-dehydropantoate 2-reductase [Anaerolineales bacterium]|nr:2-dehydropantoate 2-reductase [Anaerolineales bacterium]